jgi:hypothetical protein
VDGKKHGSGGKFFLLGGATYEGDFSGGEMTGRGTKTWPDGRTYSGDFVGGELCGRGTWTSADGEEVYEGDFRDNRREGQGCSRLRGGDTYSGAFSAHRFHGRGSYLRENCFVVTSTFASGVAQGASAIKWHKAGSYDGDLSGGCMHGSGLYAAFDGSYRYQGEFRRNSPHYSVEKLHLFVDKSFASDHVEEDAKGKKKAAKPKKGDHSAEALATVSAGHELGKLVFLLGADQSPALGEHAGEWRVPLSVPLPPEQHRCMRVRLREYSPPPPPGKGQPPPEPDPAAELGAVLPLWRRRASAELRSSAWERFPASDCIRYIGGVEVLTGR